MRITLEPTEKQEGGGPETVDATVSVMLPDDELTIDEVVDLLIKPALVAYSFSEDQVLRAFAGYCEKHEKKTP